MREGPCGNRKTRETGKVLSRDERFPQLLFSVFLS